MRRVLFLLACSALLVACGGGEDSTTRVPPEEYARLADERCRELALEVTQLGAQDRIREIQDSAGSETQKLRDVAEVMHDQLQVLSKFRQEVEMLGLPSAHAGDVEEMLDKARSAEDELEYAIGSARAGDGPEFAQAMSRYAGFSLQSASIARDSELDFAICGSGA